MQLDRPVPSGGEQRIAKPLLRVGLQQGTGNNSNSSPYRNCPLSLAENRFSPELQSRRLFRTKYEAATLRENLGLQCPTSR
jgi:hypothetical protein